MKRDELPKLMYQSTRTDGLLNFVIAWIRTRPYLKIQLSAENCWNITVTRISKIFLINFSLTWEQQFCLSALSSNCAFENALLFSFWNKICDFNSRHLSINWAHLILEIYSRIKAIFTHRTQDDCSYGVYDKSMIFSMFMVLNKTRLI